MAIDIATARTEIAKLYIAAFNRVPDSDGLSFWVDSYVNHGVTLNQIAQYFTDSTEYQSTYPAYQTTAEYVEAIYVNVFGRASDAAGKAYWVARLETASTAADYLTHGTLMQAMVDAAMSNGSSDGQKLTNQATFAVNSVIAGLDNASATAQLANVTADTASIATATTAATTASQEVAGQTYNLTVNIDTIPGTTGNDTINATIGATAGVADDTYSGLDSINGGAGTDVLNYNDLEGGIDASTLGATVTNVETMNIRSVGAADVTTTTGFTGLTAINVTQGTTSNVTAATTTAVTVSGITGASTVAGGSTQTVTAVGSATLSGAAGAITATVTTAGTAQTSVQGGTNVNLTVTGLTTDNASTDITVGGTTAPTGTVVINASGVLTDAGGAGADDVAMGDIAVTGGSTVTVTQSAGITAAQVTAALTATTNDTVALGDVSVTGGAATTAVTVNQDATVTVAQYVLDTTDGVIGVTAGAVAIADKNAASGTLAGTIATVSLKNFGNTTIDSSALTTVNLEGTGTVANGTLGISRGNLTATPTANTLAINTTAAIMGAITDSEAGADDGFTTINITNSGTTTIANLTAADATALTVAGAGAFTLTASALLANVTSVNVTNTGSTTFGTTALNVDATFTSGSGDETVILGATTKAISTGAGNDTVTVGAAAITGTIDAGEGTQDTLVMSDANAVTATATATFAGKVSNFERLSLTGATNADQTVNLANLDNINYVNVGGVDTGNTLTLSNVSSGVTVNANAGTAGVIDVTQAANGTADTINFGASAATAQTVFKLDASEFETISVATDDSATTATGIAHIITTLDATAATSLTIAGDAGLTVGTLTGTALTTINASGVTAGAVTFATGALAGAATINGGAGNDVISAASALAAVTLNGNAGNDTLSGGTVADTINGGAGNDVIDGKAGADSLTGGAGRDIFAVSTVTDSNGVNVDTVTDFASGTDFLSAGNNAITYAGEAANYGTVLTTFTGLAYQAVMDTSTKTVYVDVDGDSALTAADIAINLNVSDLSQTDFAVLGTTGVDALATSALGDTVYSVGGNDTVTLTANTTTLAAVDTGNLSISTAGMDIFMDLSAGDAITFATQTAASYDVFTQSAAGATISKTIVAGTIVEYSGLYDYATGKFTSSATAAADTASTTDVAAVMYLYATTDAGTTADQGLVLVGVASQTDVAVENSVLTIA